MKTTRLNRRIIAAGALVVSTGLGMAMLGEVTFVELRGSRVGVTEQANRDIVRLEVCGAITTASGFVIIGAEVVAALARLRREEQQRLSSS